MKVHRLVPYISTNRSIASSSYSSLHKTNGFEEETYGLTPKLSGRSFALSFLTTISPVIVFSVGLELCDNCQPRSKIKSLPDSSLATSESSNFGEGSSIERRFLLCRISLRWLLIVRLFSLGTPDI